LPEIAVPPPIAKWLHLDYPHCVFGLLIFRKIIKIVAVSGQILKLKCTKFDFQISGGSGGDVEFHPPTFK